MNVNLRVTIYRPSFEKKLVQSVQEIELNIQSFSYLFTLLVSEMK